MTEYPVERPRPDHDMYRGIPLAAPGQGLMVCPTENTLKVWDYTPDDKLRCTGCGRVVSREEATGRKTGRKVRRMKQIYIVFDGPPDHESGRFVEVEDGKGNGLGEKQTGAAWSEFGGQCWRLGPFAPAKLVETLEAMQRWLEDAPISNGIHAIRQRLARALDDDPVEEPSSIAALEQIRQERHFVGGGISNDDGGGGS